jgi:hypothetical protein
MHYAHPQRRRDRDRGPFAIVTSHLRDTRTAVERDREPPGPRGDRVFGTRTAWEDFLTRTVLPTRESPYPVFLPVLRLDETPLAADFLPGSALFLGAAFLAAGFVRAVFLTAAAFPAAAFVRAVFLTAAAFPAAAFVRAVFLPAAAFPAAAFLAAALREPAALFFLAAAAAPEGGGRVRVD